MPNPLISKVKSYVQLHFIPIILAVFSALFYYLFAFELTRENFYLLITLFTALFIFYYKLIQFEKWNFKFLAVVGILFRLVFLLATPNLSQDFYRFIWDGQLILHQINPYDFSPNQLLADPNFSIPNAEFLHAKMGELSAKHFSNYPPVNQVLFAISAFFGGSSILGSIVSMRLFIVLADIGILLVGRALLLNLNLSPHKIFWYFLNPLVIIELTGNLHFEGVMLFFFVVALYFVSTKSTLLAAPFYASSILVKLVPLIFLPLFLRHQKFKRSTLFYVGIGVFCILLVLPFFLKI